MSDLMRTILAGLGVAVVAYAMGSLNFAIMISRLTKASDIRNYGSGNAGMTNMLRTFGKKAAAGTFIGDFVKGAAAVAVGRLIFSWLGIDVIDAGYIAGIFVVLGHIFPLFFGFRGGKGISTALGVMLMLNWMVFVVIAIGLIPTVFIVRIVSAVSLIGASMFPVLIFLVTYLQGGDMMREVIPSTLCALVITCLAYYAHRDNIKRLRAGTERVVTAAKKDEGSADDGKEN